MNQGDSYGAGIPEGNLRRTKGTARKSFGLKSMPLASCSQSADRAAVSTQRNSGAQYQMKATAGLLPFYLAFYDEIDTTWRDRYTAFLADIATGLQAHGIGVRTAPICCVAAEFATAVADFEAADVDCIITLHLAYSPSLEAIEALCGTELPIVMLDTTMDSAFGIDVDPDRILYNHGIHGVMDLASMLRRRGRTFEIAAGHYRDSDVLARVAGRAHNRPADLGPSAEPASVPELPSKRAAAAAHAFRNSRMLRIGPVFDGMGDFVVDADLLARRFRIVVDEFNLDALDAAVREVTDEAVDREVAADRERYDCELTDQAHARSVRVGLGLRALLESGDYDGFSVNFQAFDSEDRPANTMPFLEASKAMARGVGYAGEGDVLSAALVGALARGFGATTFTEIFCPDWAGNSLFLSHVGEISPAVAAGTARVFEKPLPFMGRHSPAVLTCATKPGPAVLVNIAPGPDETFSLILARVEVLAEDDSLDPRMPDNVRMWIRPMDGDISHFLEAYSRAGGTHHNALVLGDQAEGITAFGRMLGMTVVQIDGGLAR